MSDLDTRIRAFVGQLVESTPIAPSFPRLDIPAQEPRPKRRSVKFTVIATGSVLILVAVAVTLRTNHQDQARIQVNQNTTRTSAGPSDPSRSRDLGVVHTRLGDAHAYCGGTYTPLCAPTLNPSTLNVRQVALFFEICTPPILNYVSSIKTHALSLDRNVHQLVGSGPPQGGIWTEVGCLRPPTSKP